MSNNRNLQRLGDNQRAGAIMTPQGPAIIQVIDIPSGAGGLGGYNPGAGAPMRKVGGINILGAILRRWWLVVIVTALIGGAGVYVANNFIKPTYIAHVKISWIDRTPDGMGMTRLIQQATDVLTSREIPMLIARKAADDIRNGLETDETRIFGSLVRDRNLEDTSVQADICKKMKEAAFAEVTKATQVVDLQAARFDPVEAAAVANSFSRAFVKYCQDSMRGEIVQQMTQAQQGVDETLLTKGALQAERTRLMVDNSIEKEAPLYANLMNQVTKMVDEQLVAKVTLAAAQSKLNELQNAGKRRPDQDLEAIKLVEEEKQKDNVLTTYNGQYLAALGTLEAERAIKKDEHPDVKRAQEQVNRLKSLVAQREAEIATIITTKIDNRFKLIDASTVATAMSAVEAAQEKLKFYNDELAKMDQKAKVLVAVKAQIQAIDDKINMISRDYELNSSALADLKRQDSQMAVNSGLRIAEIAAAPEKPDQDKRIKVQAAGMVGGLFLGMLLALLIDKFDKRLRDPRDIEPLLGAPLLGTIPKISELKRVKGEHARNLIAEEFRVIRTQLLFGNPELNHKVLAITSPQPGDGKTSLAVNLAISIAKAGRRVLLIDGDLRKPDIHRIFNISDSPGFAEVIAGSHEPGAVIRKSDIDGLDVLPAGTPMTRPSELLSRPEMSRILAALGELYDHIILDTAPLLPVSDTHVLVGLVDAVLCSFNAETDRDTVTLVQEILRRSRANVIGTVMNQVKYKQSGSYHRGKSAYSSYYSTTRVPPAGAIKLPGKTDPNIATLTKQ